MSTKRSTTALKKSEFVTPASISKFKSNKLPVTNKQSKKINFKEVTVTEQQNIAEIHKINFNKTRIIMNHNTSILYIIIKYSNNKTYIVNMTEEDEIISSKFDDDFKKFTIFIMDDQLEFYKELYINAEKNSNILKICIKLRNGRQINE